MQVSGSGSERDAKSVNEDKKYLQKILSIEDTEGKTWEAKSRRRALKSPPPPPIPGGTQLPPSKADENTKDRK